MAFSPKSFYSLAASWYDVNADEATLRCVVSRAYYAALLAARDKAGITTTTGSTHHDTCAYYRSKSDPVNQRIAGRLDDLRKERNFADYDVQQTCVPRVAGAALRYSKNILMDLGF